MKSKYPTRPWAAALVILCAAASWARADVVSDWNAITQSTLLAAAPAERPNAAIDYGLVHIAMFDAINAVTPRYESFIAQPVAPASGASAEAAAATAAYRVLSVNFPSRLASLDVSYAAALAAIPDGAAKTQGVALGLDVGNAVLTWRSNDGRFTVVPIYVPGTGPGVYQFTPPGPPQPVNLYLPFVRPLAVQSLSQFRAEGPPALTSDTYTEDYNEVKRMGMAGSPYRSAVQSEIALFHTENPTTFWGRNLRNFAAAQNLPLLEHARLMALIFVAQGDALMTCFETKYHYNFWRPVTAIRAGDTDGNPSTDQDAVWAPFANTPPHPEYPAAHGCASGAAVEIIKRQLGNNASMTFSSTVPGTGLHYYERPGDLVDEISVARIYGGMHFRNSTRDGAQLGRRVANYIDNRFFRPLP